MGKYKFNRKNLYAKIVTKQVGNSLQFADKHRHLLASYSNIEDFALSVESSSNKQLKGLEYHLLNIRSAIVRCLWAEGIFIGTSILDDILFYKLKESISPINLVNKTLNYILEKKLYAPGFIVYPLHSLGFIGFGLWHITKRVNPSFYISEREFSVFPQSNSKDALFQVLYQITNQFGIKKKLPIELIEHYIRSRPLGWLIKNPIMALRCSTISGAYYENQFLLITKLKIASSFMFMFSTISTTTFPKQGFSFSTSQINNFQTLDIKHYLILEQSASKRKELDVTCTPMNVAQADLLELVNLNVEFDPRLWRYKGKTKTFNRMVKVFKEFEEEYFRQCISYRNNETPQKRVLNKMFDSLKFFRRSFEKHQGPEDNIVNLSIAIETLLSDYYTPGVYGRVLNDLEKTLRNQSVKREVLREVRLLFEARGSIVHSGQLKIQHPELQKCRLGFIYAFLYIGERFPTLLKKTERPINELVSRR